MLDTVKGVRMATSGSLRERRRADTVAEIKTVALALLADGGPEALSLRAVAREVGVSVQALYHYFDSRDALLTDLVTDAFTALADAVREGGATGGTRAERLQGAALAYRRWALEHRPAFLLALGAPVPGYAAPEGGPTTEAAGRMGEAFQEVVFGGWTQQELRAVPYRGEPAEAQEQEGPKGLPPGAQQLFVIGWATLHGFVMLEAHGHLVWTADDGDDTFLALIAHYADTVERARTATP